MNNKWNNYINKKLKSLAIYLIDKKKMNIFNDSNNNFRKDLYTQ